MSLLRKTVSLTAPGIGMATLAGWIAAKTSPSAPINGEVIFEGPSNPGLPTLIFLVGMSGSGKSTHCKAEAKSGIAVVSADQIRLEKYIEFCRQVAEKNGQKRPNPPGRDKQIARLSRPDNAAEQKLIFPTTHKRIAEALAKATSVMFDATNLDPRSRVDLIAELRRQNLNFNIEYHIFHILPETAKKRIETSTDIRAMFPADKIDGILNSMWKKYAEFGAQLSAEVSRQGVASVKLWSVPPKK